MSSKKTGIQLDLPFPEAGIPCIAYPTFILDHKQFAAIRLLIDAARDVCDCGLAHRIGQDDLDYLIQTLDHEVYPVFPTGHPILHF